MVQTREKPIAEKPVARPMTETGPETGLELDPLDINGILATIPHRYPFLLVDRVTRHVQGKRIEGYKNITINEPFFQGHFPQRPILPGVLQLEAMAQLGGVMISRLPGAEGRLAVFAGIEKARFRRMIIPGDRFDMQCELVKYRFPVGKSVCKGLVNGKLAVEAEMTFSLINP